MTASTTPATVVVGSGGFLGRAVRRAAVDAAAAADVPAADAAAADTTPARGAAAGAPGTTSAAPVRAASVPWDDQDAAVDALVTAIRGVRTPDSPWRVVWCAGTGVVATGAEVFEAEQQLIARVLETLAGDDAAPGTLFFASSAGAVYAGSSPAPFDEDSEPAPLAPYGRSKLASEERFRAWARTTGARLLVGRFSNLYGPGANLGKAQGLVSQLALAHLEGRPSSIYVPTETTRDYLYIDDAAAMVLDAMDAVEAANPGTAGAAVTKIFASGRSATITEVVAAVEDAFGEPLDVRHGADPSATYQGLDLRFASRVLPSVDARDFTDFAQGVRNTVDALRAART
ncbi:NAD-dependent epimerase/dehydratase family protein [Curtobacterium sp. A7_M15]|uniref:NAD-dependent epimerase/dehydratase family protein n=1 Tax=Curtobacterium sp. A7_M15 TaxID=3065241 RepID=UPI002737EC73|nr:NAD-dependent epimerase/dehydratase family protein [Curtobacterium sp. A7_M15]MDP4334270.1 NAD-dependent epimerase/dehydratase family protein [Curtobacterium sp. A7_M15]